MRGQIELRKEQVALADIVARALEEARAGLEERHHRLELAVAPEPLLLDADPVRLQPAARDVLLVAMTGYGQDEDRRRSREAGFNHHLVKPVDFDVLLGLLDTAPAGQRQPGGGPGTTAAGSTGISAGFLVR